MCDDLLAHYHRLSATSFIPLSSSPTWFSTQSNVRALNRTFLFLSPAYHLPPLPLVPSPSTAATTSSYPAPSKTPTPTSSTSTPFTHFPAFFDINPLWTVYAFNTSILGLYPFSDHTEMMYELVRRGDTPLPQFSRMEQQVLSQYELVEDTDWFTRTFPERRGVMKYVKCISVIDKHAPTSSTIVPKGAPTGSNQGEQKRAAYILLLPGSTVPNSDAGDHRLYIPELTVMPEYHGRGNQHFSVGKALAKMLLSAVVDVSGDLGGGAEIWTNVRCEGEAEMVKVWLEMGWEVNRGMWVVERNNVEGAGGGKSAGGSVPGKSAGSAGSRSGSGGDSAHGHHGWKFGEWGKGMKGWKERWVKALDEISHGAHHSGGGASSKH